MNAEQVFEQQAQQLREQLDVAASQLDSLTTQVTTHKAACECLCHCRDLPLPDVHPDMQGPRSCSPQLLPLDVSSFGGVVSELQGIPWGTLLHCMYKDCSFVPGPFWSFVPGPSCSLCEHVSDVVQMSQSMHV